MRRWLPFVFAALAASAPARGAGRHCLDEPRAKVLLGHTLAGQLNPLGSEHQLVLSLCQPLVRAPGILYDFTNFEMGLSNYASPTYVHQGAFVGVTPISPLQLKAEVSGIYVWTLPIDGAGYFAFPSYDADFSEDARTQDRATQAAGWVFAGTATLRGQVGLAPGLELLLANTLLAEHFRLGAGPFHYSLRRDVLLAQSDWVLKNTAAVLVEIALAENVATRVGITDDAVVVPASGRAGNLAAGVATLLVRRVGGTIRNLQPFLRVGVHTHHASANGFRQGEANALLGVNAIYELAALEP